MVDNILDMRYFRDLIPALAEESADLHLFFEVKANLRKDQLQALANAGIRVIQPGSKASARQSYGSCARGSPGSKTSSC